MFRRVTTAHTAGIVSATLCTYERSLLACTISPEAQQDFVSTLLASMIRAPQDWEQSPAITDVARAMGGAHCNWMYCSLDLQGGWAILSAQW